MQRRERRGYRRRDDCRHQRRNDCRTVTKDPLLKGDLAGHFVLTGPASFAGDIIFTTKRGTLTIDAAGTLSSTGAFETSGSVISGTGNFAGATGSLVIEGVQDPSGAFTETIEGEICLSQ